MIEDHMPAPQKPQHKTLTISVNKKQLKQIMRETHAKFNDKDKTNA
jgi:hypothetical protein